MMNLQTTQPKPLNSKQLLILHLFYRFRFTTTDILTTILNKKDKSETNRRLKTLVDQEYIGRTYEPSYHLMGKHASFHLLPKGLAALKHVPNATSKYAPTVLHSIYKDKTATDRFINHSLQVAATYCQLKDVYGDRLKYFTKSELSFEKFEYFPQPLPDAYIRLAGSPEAHYFLELVDELQPPYIYRKRIKQYIEYADSEDWEDATRTTLPEVVLLCNSAAYQSKLLKLTTIDREDLDEEDIKIHIITPNQLTDRLEPNK
jgi:hypothetical protein